MKRVTDAQVIKSKEWNVQFVDIRFLQQFIEKFRNLEKQFDRSNILNGSVNFHIKLKLFSLNDVTGGFLLIRVILNTLVYWEGDLFCMIALIKLIEMERFPLVELLVMTTPGLREIAFSQKKLYRATLWIKLILTFTQIWRRECDVLLEFKKS